MLGRPQDIIAELEKRPRLAVVTHRRPDGDALGSVLGLTRTLALIGLDAVPINLAELSSRYLFYPRPNEIVITQNPNWYTEYDCLVVMDCGVWNLLDETVQLAKDKLKVINIDHHASSVGMGGVDWVDPQASSTGEMVVRLAEAAGWKVPPEAAQGLWMAIITDTGRFSYDNSSVAALRAAAFCVENGAKPAKIARHLYQSVMPAERRLQLRALSHLEFHNDGKIAELWLRGQDFLDVGLGVEAAHEIVSLARDVDGVEVAFLACEFTPKPGVPPVVKISLRTYEPHDAIRLAQSFGGGGHQRAAGCTLKCGLEEARKRVVQTAKELYFS